MKYWNDFVLGLESISGDIIVVYSSIDSPNPFIMIPVRSRREVTSRVFPDQMIIFVQVCVECSNCFRVEMSNAVFLPQCYLCDMYRQKIC